MSLPLSDTSHAPQPRGNRHPLRFLTATSLFDGHDAAINVIRRVLQASGAEVIHLGHNRSVDEIVSAAIQEDVQGIAVSSYQGGHLEYFKYLIDRLKESDAGDIRVFGGGGGVILPDEIKQLHEYGVEHIYSAQEGQQLGLKGMVEDVLKRCGANVSEIRRNAGCALPEQFTPRTLARMLSRIESGSLPLRDRQRLFQMAHDRKSLTPVIGVTGTGGSGKSSLLDELILRFRLRYGNRLRIAVLAADPSRRKSGGALLGDRIRMNAIDAPEIFFRSVATRNSPTELPRTLTELINALVASEQDLVIVETPGIGQGSVSITALADVSLYVMTPEFGAATQLEKIDMLDYADLVALNKFDQIGAEDALRDVRKQIQRNRQDFDRPLEEMPVIATIASQTHSAGLDRLFDRLIDLLQKHGLKPPIAADESDAARCLRAQEAILPASRSGYLAEIASTLRAYREHVEKQSDLARTLQQLEEVRALFDSAPEMIHPFAARVTGLRLEMDPSARNVLDQWLEDGTSADPRDSESPPSKKSPSGLPIPQVAVPRYRDHGDILKWLMLENLPGHFPFTAGVFPYRRSDEPPTRMFAGEGGPQRTNQRFKFLSAESEAIRLSTAFDSVTLYGADPDTRPDIFGRIGNSGVSVATLDDMKILYQGFDLCDPKTSVSMTINGPAPILLAMFFNTAIDQQADRFQSLHNRLPDPGEKQAIRDKTLQSVRGTVQADILKEDQGQNTCLFSTAFSLKLMADVQQYFIEHAIRKFYSVSISGYHIAEAGGNPLTQLAFTLANGFTYVEAFLACGMRIDEIAPNLSFFFSCGMDPEFAVIGRVARRIWAVAMREHYHANARSQKLKYHVQTSGRSLHADETDFNDIRTTLQALTAFNDNCNSLHTNASDEAVTTPSEETVRKAMAIQMIVNQEWGPSLNENPSQGSFFIEQLTDTLEEAVLQEFDNLSKRGGVLGAMERGYQRNRIQEESLLYESRKHDGSLPIIGVNKFLRKEPETAKTFAVARSSAAEKFEQINRVKAFKKNHDGQAEKALSAIRRAAIHNENIFAVLMDAVRVLSLGQITAVLTEVGGKYRRHL
ncbi:MAG: methylmalonyl-CoA mutase family protein [Methylococcaceae bacterium]|nr:methylmalonyl-CoA mutase family protein [Methylococcaceae bacterium]